jgi:hypothetical protein
VPVLGHRCDNQLCQRIGPGHVEPWTAWRNRHDWLMRRHTLGGLLRDVRGARGRALAVRDTLRRDPIGRAVLRPWVRGYLRMAQLPLWVESSEFGDAGLTAA